MAGAAAVLTAAALGIALLQSGSTAEASGTVEPGPVEGYEASGHQNDAGTLSYRINPSPEFDADGTNGTLYLENPRENRYDMQVDLELEDGTVVYSSPVLEPDSHLDTDSLSEALDEGVYKAEARIFAVDRETETILGYVLQPVEIRVGNAD